MLLMETLLTIGQKIALDSARADNPGDLSGPTNNIELGSEGGVEN